MTIEDTLKRSTTFGAQSHFRSLPSLPPCPWVKICGVTRADDALVAARLGAAFVGINFWSGSKRHVSPRAAREIATVLPRTTLLVGVFVNEEPARIDDLVAELGLDLVQLHGDEPDDVVVRYAPRALRGLSASGRVADLIDACARLERTVDVSNAGSESGLSRVEPRVSADDSGHTWDSTLESTGLSLHWRLFACVVDAPNVGAQYGGVGEAWNWSSVRPLVARSPTPILVAGGVRPENVREILETTGAAGIDVASGVESEPGIKDRVAMTRLFDEVARARTI